MKSNSLSHIATRPLHVAFIRELDNHAHLWLFQQAIQEVQSHLNLVIITGLCNVTFLHLYLQKIQFTASELFIFVNNTQQRVFRKASKTSFVESLPLFNDPSCGFIVQKPIGSF